jgi:MFS transporter, LPLT family, lysophospholipid transporter
MNRHVYTLLVAQFLTAFADNAILFAAFALITQELTRGEWYQPALQAGFLVAFVLLAPWVGRLADSRSKRTVLVLGNAVKGLGAILMWLQLEPLVAYAVVGIGAAIYSPAKYGILPELVSEKSLVKANGMIEGSTIVAIVLGAVVGAGVADQSVAMALLVITATYLLSLFIALFIPKIKAEGTASGPAIPQFVKMMRGFFTTSHARFSMLGASIFWAAAVVLRVMMVAWAPAVLFTTTTSDIANLTVFIAIGIAVGAFVVPWLIPIERLRRARLAAYAMGFFIIMLGISSDPLVSKVLLLFIGVCGGIFVVPINATLQELGHRSIGAGGAVAIQNFFENVAMLVGTGLYTLALGGGIDPVVAVISLGILVIAATTVIAWHLPKVAEAWPVQLEKEASRQGAEA